MELPRHLPRKADPSDPRLRRYLTDALTAAITAFEEQARTRFTEAAVDWASRLEDQAYRQLTAAAGWFRHCVRTPPDEDDLAAFDDLAARLKTLRSALATSASPAGRQLPRSRPAVRIPAPDAAGARSAHSWRKPSPGSCGAGSSCSPPAMPTRPGLPERAATARCTPGSTRPSHPPSASPPGTRNWRPPSRTPWSHSAGTTRHPGILGRAVAALSPGPAGCALCQALAARERDAAAEAAAQAPESPLCLRHLAMALTAGPTPAAGQAMIRALGAALRADGEDMRDYALKREALHNWLVTDEESRAHQDALRQLAGLSVLTMPWADTDLVGNAACDAGPGGSARIRWLAGGGGRLRPRAGRRRCRRSRAAS